MKKLNLKKKVVSVLTDEEKQFVNGGGDLNFDKAAGTTSYSGCTGFLCCNQRPCNPPTLTLGPDTYPTSSTPCPTLYC